MRAATVLLLFSVALAAQQRDTPGAPAGTVSGTSEISGVVVTADTRQPLRRVVVSVTSDELPAPRSVITDDAGTFAFTKLPAGTYAITAKKAAYLATEFASPKPGRPGSRVALAAGEKRAATLTMFRGGAIGGTLRHADGTPAAGVSIEVLNARMIGQRDLSASDPAVTNDRGEFRIFGLMPGEYIVLASPMPGGTGEIGARTPSEMTAVLSALAQRGAGNSDATHPPQGPEPLAYGTSVNYAPVYYPGTTNIADAERLRLVPGDDRTASFSILRVPVASIEGTISGDVPSLAAVQIAIIPEVRFRFGGPDGVSITATPPNDRGEFKYGNLSPGKYRIVARAHRSGPAPSQPPPSGSGGGRIGGPPTGDGSGEAVFAVADVEINGADVKGVGLSLESGGSVFGKVVFDSGGTPAPADFSRIRVGLSVMGEVYGYNVPGLRVGNMLSDVPASGLWPDGTFKISGVGPSVYTMDVTLPPDIARVWKLRSAVVDGRDLLDTRFTGPNVQLRDVTITLSDRKTEISGVLTSSTGQPANEYYVIAFSADKAHWRAGARRSVSTRPATNGRYVFSDLPPGEYLVAALTDLDPNEWQDPVFLSQVAPAAIRITIAEGQTKSQDLQIK
jgi:uncharacterized protein (DUF2141 family)